jgi:hypothetical protein
LLMRRESGGAEYRGGAGGSHHHHNEQRMGRNQRSSSGESDGRHRLIKRANMAEFLKQGEQPQEAVAVVVAEGFQRMGAVMTVAAMEVQVMKEAADSKTSTEAQVVLIVVVMMTTKGEDQVETRGAETTAMKENSRSVLNTRCQG